MLHLLPRGIEKIILLMKSKIFKLIGTTRLLCLSPLRVRCVTFRDSLQEVRDISPPKYTFFGASQPRSRIFMGKSTEIVQYYDFMYLLVPYFSVLISKNKL